MAKFRDVGYARLSHLDEQERGGIARQKEDIARVSEQTGGELVTILSDNAISASKYARKKRKEYPRLLEMARAGLVDRAVIYDTDRLLRIPRELEDLIDLVDELGDRFQIVNVHGTLRLNTADDQFIARVIVAKAAKESDDTSRRLRRMFDQQALDGKAWSTRAFGYACLNRRPCEGAGCCHAGPDCDHVPRHKRCCRIPGCPHDGVTVIGREAALIRQAADAVLAGEGIVAVARGWNTVSLLLAVFGHSPIVGPQSGRQWTSTAVREVLCGYKQAGLRRHRAGTDEEAVFPGDWEPIIAPETREALVRLFSDPARRRKNPPRRQPFTGVLCSPDGRSLSRDAVRGRPCYRTYTRTGLASPGDYIGIAAEPVERFIEELLFDAAEEGPLAERIAARREAARAEKPAGEDPADLERQLVQLGVDHDDGLIGRAEWLTRRERLQSRLARAQAAADTNGHEFVLHSIDGNLREVWPDLSVDRKRAILHAVFARVEVHPATRTGGGRLTREKVAERVRPVWRV